MSIRQISHCLKRLSASRQASWSKRPGSGQVYNPKIAQSNISKRLASAEADYQHAMSHTTAPSQPRKNYKYVQTHRSASPDGSGRLVKITICNPAKLNILSIEAVNELEHAISKLRTDTSTRVAIFTGQTEPHYTASFCAGANIREMESISAPDQARAFITRIYNLCQLIYNWNVVTIARIDGLCFGAGLELAACCDFRYGTQRSMFSMKEVALGIPSVVHARLLANIVGWQVAKRMVLLAKVIEADEAQRSNLLDSKCSTAEEMDGQIQDDVQLMASYGRQAMRVQKELILDWEQTSLSAGIRNSIDSFAEMWKDGGSEPKKHMRDWMDRSRDKKHR